MKLVQGRQLYELGFDGWFGLGFAYTQVGDTLDIIIF